MDQAHVDKSKEELIQEIHALQDRIRVMEPVVRDVNGLRDDLIECRRMNRALLEASADAVMVCSAAGVIQAVNQIGAMRLKRTVDDLLNRSIFEIIPYELVEQRKLWLSQVVDSQKPLHFKDEYRSTTYGHRLYPYFDENLNAIRVVIITRDITANEAALRAMRESEARYRAILEDQTELICRYLPDGRLSYVNEAYSRYFNKDRQELINTNFIPHIPEEDIEQVIRHVNSLGPDHPVTSFEHKVIMDTNEVRWQHWTHRAIYDADGNLTEYQAVGRDITRRRIAQEALYEGQRRYRSLFEDSPISLWEEDFSKVKGFFDAKRAEGVSDFHTYFLDNPNAALHCAQLVEVVDINKATLGLFNAPDKNTLRENMLQILTPDSHDVFRAQLIALANGSRSFSAETERRTLDGRLKGVSLHLSVAPGYEDSLGKVILSFIDISERRQAEQELRENRSFLHQIINTVPSPIFVKDREGRFVLVNEAMCELYGATVEEMLGKRGEDFNPHQNELAIFRAEDLEVLDSRQPIFIPQRVITNAQGEPRWHSTTKLPLPGKDQVLGVAVDITERKNAEEERANLERHIRQSQKMQALGTLAGGIAHDFNNMIFAILGFVRLALKRAPKETKLAEYLLQVQSAGLRASDLVRQILTFSRQTEQDKSPVYLSSLIKEVAKLLQATLPSSIEFVLDLPTQLAEEGRDTVLGDPTQIHQVLMNLCTNSAHAMREANGELRVSLHDISIMPENAGNFPGQALGAYLALQVKDTGHGIDPTIIDQIYDPFFTTKAPGEGTGMGLSVVHGIIKSHNGFIQVKSEQNKGTDFTIYLPKFDEHEEQAGGELCEAPRGCERILFVDDEELIVSMTRDMLSQLGYRITALNDPKEALETFRSAPEEYDLVITDQTMPHLTGMDLAHQILAIRGNIPIVLLTGYSESVSPESAKEAGISEFIMKPVVEEQLAQTIRSLLDTN